MHLNGTWNITIYLIDTENFGSHMGHFQLFFVTPFQLHHSIHLSAPDNCEFGSNLSFIFILFYFFFPTSDPHVHSTEPGP